MPALGVSARWIEQRKAHWDTLESLIKLCARRGVRELARPDLRTLALLYRQTAADLSVVREDPAGAALASYLNTLLGRAHNLIYSGDPPKARGIVHFYARVFPQIFRQTAAFTLAATALFAGGFATGATLAWTDPGFERVVLGARMVDTIERGEMWTH